MHQRQRARDSQSLRGVRGVRAGRGANPRVFGGISCTVSPHAVTRARRNARAQAHDVVTRSDTCEQSFTHGESGLVHDFPDLIKSSSAIIHSRWKWTSTRVSVPDKIQFGPSQPSSNYYQRTRIHFHSTSMIPRISPGKSFFFFLAGNEFYFTDASYW